MQPTPELIAFLKKIHLFSGLDDGSVALFAEKCSQRECQPGEVIIQESSMGDNFFIIKSGSVEVTHKKRKGIEKLATLVAGDYFGEMSIFYYRRRRTATITAKEKTTLLVISKSDLKQIARKWPQLKANFRVAISSRKLAQRMHFKWLRSDEGEVIYYLARKHPFLLMRSIFLPGMLSLFSAMLALLSLSRFIQLTFTQQHQAGNALQVTTLFWVSMAALMIFGLMVLWRWVDWGNDYYIVTNQRVVWLEKVIGIYDSREESPLSAVQRVSVVTELTGRIFNYGDLVIRTIVGSSLTLKNVDSPYQAAALIEEHWRRSKTTYQKMQEEAMKEVLRERILHPELVGSQATQQSIVQKPQKKKDPYEGQHGLGNLFRIRFERSNVITYRKHWFALVRQSWVPGLGILGLIAALFIGLFLSKSLPGLKADTIILSCGAWLILFLVFGGWWYYQWVDWSNDIFQVTPDQVIDIDKTPLGSVSSDIASLDNILNIEYRREGLMELIFNYGTVYITVGGGKQMAFEDVYNPSAVQADIERRRMERIAKIENDKIKAERERMADWFAAYYHSQEALRNSESGDSGQIG
ncbi:MAG: cyclic nucleotide-binding domain-containing protein [Candidatus Villigracilaceae bacterium]